MKLKPRLKHHDGAGQWEQYSDVAHGHKIPVTNQPHCGSLWTQQRKGHKAEENPGKDMHSMPAAQAPTPTQIHSEPTHHITPCTPNTYRNFSITHTLTSLNALSLLHIPPIPPPHKSMK